MDLHISTEELESVADIEDNCGRHISLVNDIYSYEKERLASQSIEQEGAILCNAVQVLANQLDLGVAPARHMLWILIREWEYTHQDLVKRRIATLPKCTVELQAYMNGLEYHMSGNELWSRTTKRYSQAWECQELLFGPWMGWCHTVAWSNNDSYRCLCNPVHNQPLLLHCERFRTLRSTQDMANILVLASDLPILSKN